MMKNLKLHCLVSEDLIEVFGSEIEVKLDRHEVSRLVADPDLNPDIRASAEAFLASVGC